MRCPAAQRTPARDTAPSLPESDGEVGTQVVCKLGRTVDSASASTRVGVSALRIEPVELAEGVPIREREAAAGITTAAAQWTVSVANPGSGATGHARLKAPERCRTPCEVIRPRSCGLGGGRACVVASKKPQQIRLVLADQRPILVGQCTA